MFISETEQRNLQLTQFANRVLPKAIDFFCVSLELIYCMILSVSHVEDPADG